MEFVIEILFKNFLFNTGCSYTIVTRSCSGWQLTCEDR